MTFWDDFINNWYVNSNTYNHSQYPNYTHFVGQNANRTGPPPNFVQKLAMTLNDINDLLSSLLNNTLPKSQILSENISIGDDGLFNLELLVDREEDETTRRYKITVEEVGPDSSDDDDDSDEPAEDTTEYFTP